MQDILKKLVEKAINNGWGKTKASKHKLERFCRENKGKLVMVMSRRILGTKEFEDRYSISDLLFDHEFMKAVCGEWCSLHNGSCGDSQGSDGCDGGGDECYYYGGVGAMKVLVERPTDQERLEHMEQFAEVSE